MIAHDINQHLKPPSLHVLYSVHAVGGFLRLEYHAWSFGKDTLPGRQCSTVVVYLNDMGREVLRTEDVEFFFDQLPSTLNEPVHKQSFWIRLYLKYIEVMKWLKKL